MSKIARAKEIIKEYIRSAPRDNYIGVPVADEANLAVFSAALKAPEIQRMMQQKSVEVNLYIPENAVTQCIKNMLHWIKEAGPEVEKIVFPYLAQDYQDALAALESTDVQMALKKRNITAEVKRVDNKPVIVIAPISAAIDGSLKEFERKIYGEL